MAYDAILFTILLLDHPEGTGHSIPPFESLWFCGIGKENIEKATQLYKNNDNKTVRIAKYLDELASQGLVTFDNRPNPRKRRQLKQTSKPVAIINRNQNFKEMERNIDDHEVGGREVGSPSKRRNKMQKPSPSSSLQPTITDAVPTFNRVEQKSEKKDNERTKSMKNSSKYRDTNGVRTKKRF